MLLPLAKKHIQSFEALRISNSPFFLLAFYELGKPSTLNEVNKKIALETGLTFSPGQQQNIAEKLVRIGILKSEVKERRGRIVVYNYYLTPQGLKLVEALKRFLEELEGK